MLYPIRPILKKHWGISGPLVEHLPDPSIRHEADSHPSRGRRKGARLRDPHLPRLENFLQENANPLVRVGEALFDRLAVEFIQRMAHLCLETTLMVAPEIQTGIPKYLQKLEPDTVCKVLVDVTFVEILLFRAPLTQR